MWITRYTEKITITQAALFTVLVVTGARQAGKTSLLKRLFPNYNYITLDDPSLAELAKNMPGRFIENIVSPAIIDEVQYAPELFRHIKIAVDKNPIPGSFILTGSQQFDLMQNITESLAGRCAVINLMTLSIYEINKAVPVSISRYIVTGGYPVLYSGKKITASDWFPSYINTYLERDVRNITNIHNLRDFNRFIRALSLRTAQILSLSDLARDVGVSPNTIKSWLNILEASGIIKLLEPYFSNMGKRLVKSPKIYFTDTGLLCHLLGIITWKELIASPLGGSIWETYAFIQINHYLLMEGTRSQPLWFWRDQSGNEVDFLIVKGGRFIAFEAKLKELPDKNDCRGFEKLKNFYGNNSMIKGLIICPAKNNFPVAPDIEAVNGIGLKF